MKIIYLDFDGVINTLLPYKGQLIYFYSKHNKVNNKQAIQLLNLLVKKTKAKVIISSSWKLDGLEKCKQILKNSGFKGEVIDITPRRETRTDEISESLKEYNSDKYIILDDELVSLPFLIKCDSLIGFTVKEYFEALSYLS